MIATQVTGRTRGGTEWIPHYVASLNQARCIGCGRCFKSCSRQVFTLVERQLNDDDDDDSEETRKVMSLANPEDCIGCQACSKACPKSCLTHEPLSLAG
ncbi:ferredoxin III, nif-specific [Aquisphaera insulae]|uniref:ferredoxin III, nif-specific n=1 Tax=Aquisphaera insulae TaxID=2712864 RepID=UPI0013EABD52|nr:ferredoxin III, nif-specific [Aquisphaera insulae]